MAENKFCAPDVAARCVPMSRLQAVLSGKWKILILWYVAFYRVQRFGELMRRLDGITQSTLTKQLRELEADGFLRRKVYPEVPPRVEYSLTALGESFSPSCGRCWPGARPISARRAMSARTARSGSDAAQPAAKRGAA